MNKESYEVFLFRQALYKCEYPHILDYSDSGECLERLAPCL